MRKKVVAILVLAVGLLPASRGKNRLLNLFGHEIHETARIAPLLLRNVDKLRVGARSRVRLGNLFQNLRLAEVGHDTQIGPLNQFTAHPGFRNAVAGDPDLVGVFKVGDFATISRQHWIDCSGGFIMGRWGGIGGRDVMIYSHSVDLRNSTISCAPTRLGDCAFIGPRCTVAMGASLPDNSVLGMGAVLMPGGAKESMKMYVGVPARDSKVDISGWAGFDYADEGPATRNNKAPLPTIKPLPGHKGPVKSFDL